MLVSGDCIGEKVDKVGAVFADDFALPFGIPSVVVKHDGGAESLVLQTVVGVIDGFDVEGGLIPISRACVPGGAQKIVQVIQLVD